MSQVRWTFTGRCTGQKPAPLEDTSIINEHTWPFPIPINHKQYRFETIIQIIESNWPSFTFFNVRPIFSQSQFGKWFIIIDIIETCMILLSSLWPKLYSMCSTQYVNLNGNSVVYFIITFSPKNLKLPSPPKTWNFYFHIWIYSCKGRLCIQAWCGYFVWFAAAVCEFKYLQNPFHNFDLLLLLNWNVVKYFYLA